MNIDQIPVISTEGGVFTPEHKNWGGLPPHPSVLAASTAVIDMASYPLAPQQ